MRAAFRTWVTEVTDAREDVAETALAHLVGTETQRAYDRSERFHMRTTLMDDWGLWVDGQWGLFANEATAADRREAVMRLELGNEEFEEFWARIPTEADRQKASSS